MSVVATLWKQNQVQAITAENTEAIEGVAEEEDDYVKRKKKKKKKKSKIKMSSAEPFDAAHGGGIVSGSPGPRGNQVC